jgi:hypothetical protein
MHKLVLTLLSTGSLRLSVIVLLILSQACAVPNFPVASPGATQDLNFLETVVMSTMISGATQTAAAPSVVPVDSPSPSPTFTLTPELPTFTPSFTPSATLSLTPVSTATSLLPLISVSVATNCRVGPGRAYDRVGALLVGQVAEVVGRHPNGTYWYIRNPSQSSGFCWLWGEYATVTGNFAALPVFTPPPTPTPLPDFKRAYEGLETCNNRWWVDIELTNAGGLVFESLTLTVRDLTTDAVVSLSSDVFHNVDGCNETFTRDALNPGATRTVSSQAFTYNPRGHTLRATITLCSREEQSGFCMMKKITFRP